MTLELNRLRAFLLALALLMSAGLIIESVTPVADAAKKSKQKKKAKKAKKGPRKGPAGVKFYTPPKKMPSAHGKLIWQRKAGGIVPLKNASSTKLVLYTSKSTSGKTVAVSGSVSFPKGRPPKGGWPLITWGHSTTGIADKCAPSRNTKNGPVVEGISYIDPVLNGWLKAGYAVARSDFQGLGTPGTHPYIVGKAAGRDVLDIARAARQLGPKVSNRFVIGGHSQGGHAALFAAGLAAQWTPDLKLRGTVAYAPGSQLKTQAQFLPVLTAPNSLTALAAMLFRGVSTSYPSLDAQTLLSDEILPFYPDTGKECLDRLSEPTHLGGIAPSKLFRPGADLTEVYEILDQQNPVLKTAAPILLLQGINDEATPKFLTDQLNAQLNEIGNTVDYRTYPDVGHFDLPEAVQPDALAFLKDRLPSGR